ncbi:hypothetical protein MGL_0970 [Malassezia globosa CBS 7966]|uniref:Prefoldin subunit 3 n=1 Tax=Malassezia globosa (strain ATCC MYA-4612 / CBS 7966) TaxID=425265 RepID=A8PVW4_MALGO|nr:uncharacterized protein MGL_0970 [Malassezia globosa CBS 7966]EDP44488.1 hypothetical protein MGL_0970 [Malassezia globosa CBS 7966]
MASTEAHDSQLRGIPTAPFVTDVAEFVGGADKDVMPTLKQFQDAISKYKFMELSTAQRRKGLEQKIPDIGKTLQMVEYLKARQTESEPLETTFELNDTLYARAHLEPTEKVHLWLGANVMLSYDIDEAIVMLQDKLATAKKGLQLANEDLGFLRDQITTMEVNTARVHNWDVKRRRDKKQRETLSS